MLCCTADRRTIRQGSSKGSWLSVLPQRRAETQFCPTLGQSSGFETEMKISAESYFEVYERTLWLSHASFLVLSNTFFQVTLGFDSNEDRAIVFFVLVYPGIFSPPSTPVPVGTDDIEEEMPLTSHTQGFTAQVNRLSYSVHVGMATTFLIVSFIFYCNFHLTSGRWRHHAVLNRASENLHMRLLMSPLIRLPYLYYLLNKRNHSKQVESCWRYKSMGSGAV